MKIKKIAHHRNGVGGRPFSVITFKDENTAENMVAIVPDSNDGSECYVLDIDLLNKGIIEFGNNSWRGDYYANELLRAIESDEDAKRKQWKRME